jgi:KTSC domain
MERIKIKSRLITAIAYDIRSSRLEIEFHDGKVEPYTDIPEQVYRNLLSADSPGSYYRHHIRESRPYVRTR